MCAQLVAVAVDSADAEVLAAFWREAMGYEETVRWSDHQGTEYVELRSPELPTLLFQPVDGPTPGKNRLHLDVAPAEGSQDNEIARLCALGASVVRRAPENPWVVLADPEGNEFCVLRSR